MNGDAGDQPAIGRPLRIDPLLRVRLLAFVDELLALEQLARRSGAVDVADAMHGVADAAAVVLDTARGSRSER